MGCKVHETRCVNVSFNPGLLTNVNNRRQVIVVLKQYLVNTLLSFKKDGFKIKLNFLVQMNNLLFKWYCLKIYTFLKVILSNNSSKLVKINQNLSTVVHYHIFALSCKFAKTPLHLHFPLSPATNHLTHYIINYQ